MICGVAPAASNALAAATAAASEGMVLPRRCRVTAGCIWRNPQSHDGEILMIVRRPGEDEREVLDEGAIDTVLPGVSDGNYVDASIGGGGEDGDVAGI